MSKPVTRPAQKNDIPALVELVAQLGYPSTPEQIQKRFDILTGKPDEAIVFVAQLNERVVGWVHVHIYNLLVDDPEAEIGGLVVDQSMRGQGIGAALMSTAETWAKEKHCPSVYLRSNVVRTPAHEFYKNIGYTLVKSQHAFRKTL